MALTDYKITDTQVSTYGVQAAPDKLTGTAAQNKALFDRLITSAVQAMMNGLIDALVGTGGAGEIGIDSIEDLDADTVQAALEALKTVIDGHYVTAGQRSGYTLGVKATAEGYLVRAIGRWAHAEGWGTVAEGEAAHADGSHTEALGDASHASGSYTVANGANQFVFGRYNEADAEGRYIEIVGKGRNGAPSNARTLDWEGNERLAGRLTLGAGPTADMDAATKHYVDTEVDRKVVEIGAGDMAKASYDADGAVANAGGIRRLAKTPRVVLTIPATDWQGSGPYTQELSGVTGAELVYWRAADEDYLFWHSSAVDGNGRVNELADAGFGDWFMELHAQTFFIAVSLQVCLIGGEAVSASAIVKYSVDGPETKVPLSRVTPDTWVELPWFATEYSHPAQFRRELEVTENTVANVHKTPELAAQLLSDGVTDFFIHNDAGTLTVYAYGAQPTAALSVPVTLTETLTFELEEG